MSEIETTAPQVVAQKGKTVGDENFEAREPEFEVVKESVRAQVAGRPEADRTKVQVHETSVVLDEVITDPSSPLAVQVPDAGRGTLDLPIHALAAQTVEQVFAAKAAQVEEVDNGVEPNPAA